MDRTSEFDALYNAPVPAALDDCVAKARRRAKRHRFHARWGAAISSAAGVAAAFVLAVNLSLPFALACGRVPVIRELAAAVAFSSSLREAVRNDYVQLIGQSQTVNGLTMTVDYVIADKKQVNVFYHFDGDYTDINGIPRFTSLEDGESLIASTIGGGTVASGEISNCTLEFSDGATPSALRFAYNVELLVLDSGDNTAAPAQTAAPDAAPGDGPAERPVLAAFSFELGLDPAQISQGESYDLNQWVELDGQRILLERAEIYPTHMRIELSDDPDNTAWLRSLEFYVEDESGRKNEPISNGITGTGSTGSPATASLHQESTFFWNSKKLTLHITGCQWLDKDRQYVTIDLDKGTTDDPLPEGVLIGGAERTGKNVTLYLLGQEPPGNDETHMSSYQIAGWTYFSPDGEERHIRQSGSTHSASLFLNGQEISVPEDYFTEDLLLDDYPWDTVKLEMTFTRNTTLDAPVSVDLK